jgi:hypothetical protein
MTAKKTADQWFAEYGGVPPNLVLLGFQGICVTAIYAGGLGFIWMIPVPESWMMTAPWFNWDLLAIAALMTFQVRVSPALSAGVFLFLSLCSAVIAGLDFLGLGPVWKFSAVALAAGLLGQLIASWRQGRNFSGGKDVVFLLLAPAWLMSFVYRRLGQRY